MAQRRSMLVVLTMTLGLLLPGCSKSVVPEHATANGEEPSDERARQTDQDQPEVPWWHDATVQAKLRLTDDQLAAIDELMRGVARHGSQLRQEERRLNINYLRALAQEPYDPELVDRVSQRLIRILSERDSTRVESLRRVRDILTQEQWTRLWEVAPRALQIGRIRVFRGPSISLTDTDISPAPAP